MNKENIRHASSTTGLGREHHPRTLCDYIRIPNKSPMFDPDWEANGHMQRAVELLDAWCDDLDIEGFSREVMSAARPHAAAVLAEIAATADATKPERCCCTVTTTSSRSSPAGKPDLSPWEPVLRDGKLYGRGGADDGYALFGSLTAIAALQAEGIPHGRCVVMIEGCEESGSFDLPSLCGGIWRNGSAHPTW